MTSPVLNTSRKEQSIWSQAANVLKDRYERARALSLGVGVVGALIEAGVSTWPDGGIPQRVLAVAGGVLIALMPVIAAFRLKPANLRAWLRARSASEGLKSVIHRYLVRVGEFEGDDRDLRLQDAVDELLTDVDDLQWAAAGITPKAPDPTSQLSLSEYIAQRIDQQIEDYYQPRADDHQRMVDRWRLFQFVLALVAAALGVVAGWHPVFGLWVGAFTTASGSVAAHMAAGRYEHLVISYRVTARRLASLRDRWKTEFDDGDGPPEQREAFIERCEAAISIENQGWMAGFLQEIDS